MDRNFGEPFQCFLNLAMGGGTCHLAPEEILQDGTNACAFHASSVPRVINQRAFYTAISKGAKTGVCRPDNLRLQGKVLRGLLVALSFIKSHI